MQQGTELSDYRKDAVQLDDEPMDVKHKQYSEALISHFERHIKGANVVTMYPQQK
ncbi:hypothetical protein [Prevotella nigrescens]